MGDTIVRINSASDNNNNDASAETNDENTNSEIIYPGVRAMPYIIGNEAVGKLAAVSMLLNFSVYLTSKYRMKIVTANQTLNLFSSTSELAAVVGAYLSDTFFGRYNCIAVGSVASVVGMVMLALTAAIPSLRDHVGFLYAAFAFLVIASCGVRSTSLPFGADQFPPNSRGADSFFMWYFATTGIAFLVSFTFIVYLQKKSWTIGLAVPAALAVLSVSLFFYGTSLYVRVRPQGSPFTSFAQVLVAAFYKRQLVLPRDPSSSLFDSVPPHPAKLHHTDQFRFLDRAAIIASQTEINIHGLAANLWRLCTVQQVEEVKCCIRLLPVWLSCVFFNIHQNVLQRYTVFQAMRLNKHLGGFEIPAQSFNLFGALGGILLILGYDRIIVPAIQRRRGRPGGITLLQRMGTGIILGVLAMLAAGLVEKIRKDAALSSLVSTMSAFVLLPQIIQGGLAEACGMTAQTNFYYEQMPANAKTVAQAMVLLAGAASGYIASFLYSVFKGSWLAEDFNQGNLDFFYYLIAAVQAGNFGYFLMCSRWYRPRGAGN